MLACSGHQREPCSAAGRLERPVFRALLASTRAGWAAARIEGGTELDQTDLLLLPVSTFEPVTSPLGNM